MFIRGKAARVQARWASLPLALVFAGLVPDLAAAALQCSAADKKGSFACTIDPTIDPGALCNDGTAPAFWVRPGSGSGRTHWIIWLEGGGSCTDQASCTARAQNSGGLVTSDGFTASDGVGALSPDMHTNPLLYNANTVLVHYCSSDDWSGGYSSGVAFSPTDPTTWNFQGRRIALAAVASLNELKLGFPNAAHILLGGTSAGGEGITITANDILPVLPAARDIRLANDAGFALDIGEYDPNVAKPYIYPGQPNAFDTSFTNALSLWHGHGDSKCAAGATTLPQRIDCYNSSLVLQQGLIPVPSFVAESQIDLAQVSDELCPLLYGNCAVSHDPKSMQGVYTTAFGVDMASTLVGHGTPAAYAVYSPDSYMHVILTDPSVFTTKYVFPNGRLSAMDVFDLWLRSPGGKRIVDIGTGPGVQTKIPAAQSPR